MSVGGGNGDTTTQATQVKCIMQRLISSIVVVALLFGTVSQADTITHGTTTINMDFVTVSNPGNSGDTTGNPYPCGAVNHTYNICKYEVSENQWDAVVAADTNDLLTHLEPVI